MSDSENQKKSDVNEKTTTTNKPKLNGPATGGFFEIKLPENWGTIRMWAEQQQVFDKNGYEHYVLRFNDQNQMQSSNEQQQPPKPLEGNQIVREQFDHNNDIKETNAVTVCSGNIEQTLEQLQRKPQPKETVKIQWNEYSYDPLPDKMKTEQQQQSVTDQQQSNRHFEETLRRRG
ncbi:hypothetical protein BLA29_008835 [Euroglyphus maynei]|uniref:Uncharacterized protein n=1 Tax=Euroglyphus maynei TaxID=6958 RepID=A0A1Y3B5T7_EURMA|nr:hypothetical protein BLA29_008835 [Euroglyphus maynei]